MRASYWIKPIALALGTLIPAVLVTFALTRLPESIGAAKAKSAIQATLSGGALSQRQYREAASRLTDVAPRNGDLLVSRAELEALGDRGRAKGLQKARGDVIRGLQYAPANPRGWTLLCEIDTGVAPHESAKCMDTALYIAPFDWYVARRRLILATYLWPDLSSDDQKAAARRARLMWEVQDWYGQYLRDALLQIYHMKNGTDLLNAAFQGDNDELRAFNRWLIHQEIVRGNG